MDANIAYKSVGAAYIPPARTDIQPVREAVPTLLPQPALVVPALKELEKPAAYMSDYQRVSAEDARVLDETRERLERQIEYSDDAGELVFKAIDPRNGIVVTQTPNEAVVKLRAYLQELRTSSPLISTQDGSRAAGAPDSPAPPAMSYNGSHDINGGASTAEFALNSYRPTAVEPATAALVNATA